MDLEDFLHNPRDAAHIQEIIILLAKSSSDLLKILEECLGHIMGTVHKFRESHGDSYEATVELSARMVKHLEKSLSDYRDWRRLDVIKPFASVFDPSTLEGSDLAAPSHRGLFWAFSYQNALMSCVLLLLLLRPSTDSISSCAT